MKTLVLTLVLSLMLMSGSALKCHHCLPQVRSKCISTIEVCSSQDDACLSAHFTIYPFTYFRRCSSLSDCLILQTSPSIKARCCQSDLCN
ncbi:CD59 glycoprotein-like [Neoarius graeffei]|uniref:CD59 glycoprotein-like n=1 Tax=Neoarius graeffei TaxID=443677 RepID=UPI00298D152C|nr:CD59 glycoprotein-like [Neoarius graeffei]